MDKQRSSTFALLSCAVVGAIAAPLAAFLALSSEPAARQSDRTEMVLTDDLVHASQAQVSAERMVSMSRAYVLTREPELLARVHAAEAKLQQTLLGLEARANALDEVRLFEPIRSSAARYRETLQRFLVDPTISASSVAVVETLIGHVIPARDRFEATLDELITRRRQQVVASQASTGELAARAVPWMVVVSVLGVVACFVLARAALEPRAAAAPANGFRRTAAAASRRRVS